MALFTGVLIHIKSHSHKSAASILCVHDGFVLFTSELHQNKTTAGTHTFTTHTNTHTKKRLPVKSTFL